MRELSTIQKCENLNKVFAADEPGNGGANHEYDIYPAQDFNEKTEPYIVIRFQNGARKLPDSQHGILDTDLLEIVRDRLKGLKCMVSGFIYTFLFPKSTLFLIFNIIISW